MNFEQVEAAVKKLAKKLKPETFIYDFLLAFNTPKATITMLKNGSRNLSKKDNEIICKKKILFSVVDSNVEDYFEEVISDKGSFKHDPRFIVITDHKELFALDTKSNDKIDFELKDIDKKFDFFLPLAGIEKKDFQHENAVDIKAAEKLAKLFDLIKADNHKSDDKSLHSLNVFLTRLLFCYFAEDTDIFPQGVFTKSIGSHTQVDGSDLSDYLKRLFAIMNVEARPSDLPDYIAAFPYVNGGLFAESHPIPKFSKKSRSALLDVGDLDWAEINPDIFGSMIQAVVHPDQRAGLGMHYTSVSNIMKVIDPLFLSELYDELDKSKKSEPKLKKLLKRISEIKIFDPACGSGNFLIIAYKELRKLEMQIYSYLPNEMKFSYIPLSNFYGIEIDDFAHEVAILSLWLTEHQMDILFAQEFGEVKASLPLKDGGNIVCDNAVTSDWLDTCPNDDGSEIYIIGNPPYLGASVQEDSHKKDIKDFFGTSKYPKKIDYIACWFLKAASYVKGNQKFAFVTTNSVSQGEQVALIWPRVFEKGLEIFFAHKSFLWSNNAKNKAAVFCSIIGCRTIDKKPKYLFDESNKQKVKNINAYLIPAENVIVYRRKDNISNLPEMLKGNIPIDGGHYMLTKEEKDIFLSEDPRVKPFLKKIVGSKEFINSIERWCIWITDDLLSTAKKIPIIASRIKKVKKLRESGGSQAQGVSYRPHQFYACNRAEQSQIVVSTVSSERREYIPIGFLDKETIVSGLAQVIYDPEPYIFSLLCSRMHMIWVKAVTGRLKNDFRYSGGVCYNSFPVTKLSNNQKDKLQELAYKILEVREKYPSKSLAKLYDPDLMPDDLRKAHAINDKYVENLYTKLGFNTDLERLTLMFDLYKKMDEDINE